MCFCKLWFQSLQCPWFTIYSYNHRGQRFAAGLILFILNSNINIVHRLDQIGEVGLVLVGENDGEMCHLREKIPLVFLEVALWCEFCLWVLSSVTLFSCTSVFQCFTLFRFFGVVSLFEFLVRSAHYNLEINIDNAILILGLQFQHFCYLETYISCCDSQIQLCGCDKRVQVPIAEIWFLFT